MITLEELLCSSQSEVWYNVYGYEAPNHYRVDKLGKYIGYIHKDKGIRPLIVCHLDTCNHSYQLQAHDIIFDEINLIYSLAKGSKATCLGGDDRVGVFLALKLLSRGVIADFLFTCDEEIGGIGAKEFALDYYTYDLSHSCFIEIDRRGINHIATYGYDNDELEKLIDLPIEQGSYTDICDICSATGIAGYNIGCGYYNQHTIKEYININDVDRCYRQLLTILPKLMNKVYKHNYITPKYKLDYNDYLTSSPNDFTYDTCAWCGEIVEYIDSETGCCLDCLRVDGYLIEEYLDGK